MVTGDLARFTFALLGLNEQCIIDSFHVEASV